MEPHDRGRGRGRGRGRKPQQYFPGRGRSFLPLSEFPILGESSSSPKTKTVKEALEQGPKYFKKAVTEPLIVLSEGDLNLTSKDPWYLKERYLQTQQYKVQEGKPRYVYEAILTETASVQILHHYYDEQNKKSAITHSKIHIIKVIHPQEWGLSTFATRTLKINDQKYNYWDYIEAWTYALYYQNPVKTHSWFIIINQEIESFPSWFLLWWEKHSPELEIFPDSIKNLLPTWYKFHPKLKGITAVKPPIGQDMLWFCTEFRITWIWQWKYELSENHLNLPELQRNFFVKWWSRFETEECVAHISETIKEYKKHYDSHNESTTPNQGSVNFVQQMKIMIQKQFPEYSEQDQDLKLLEVIQHQYLALQRPNTSQQDSRSDTSMASQELNTGSFACLAGEAQDPNSQTQRDDSEDDTTDADLWSSFIELKSLKNKGKNQQK